jgi:tetratricopeptide (TPR) repeat protein
MTNTDQNASPQQQGMTIDQAMAQAHARWEAGQAQHAEMLCRQVLQAWPGHPDALHLLGLMAHAFGNLDAAIDYLRQACRATRPPPVYFANLAEMCRQRGLLAEAEQAGRRAVALDPTLTAGWNNLGIVLQEQGKLDESLACLERVAQMRPDDALARNNIGNTLKRMGRLAEAKAQYEAALALNSGYAEAHSNLAHLLNDLGEADAALASARRAMEANPQLADAYINAIGVENGRRRYPEALRWADALLSFEPMHVGGLTAKATVLRHLDRNEEALAVARLAASAAPDDSDAQNALGEALQALNRPQEAMTAFDKAVQGSGLGVEKAVINRVTLMMEQGDKAGAEQAAKDAIARYPNTAFAWSAISDLKKFAPGDPDIARMEALLRPGGVEARHDRVVLHFALGKAWMDAREPAKAFAHLNEGNRMHRETFAYDAEATDAWLKRVCDAYDEGLYTRLAGAGAQSEAPVFVLGMPRSGTSLVEQILASHPQVHGAGELSHLSRLVDPYGGVGEIPKVLTHELAAELGRAYLNEGERLAGGKPRVVDKMPANFMMVGLIPLILPGARIIHVRRDPVDNCLSCYSKHFAKEQHFTYDQAELGRFYRSYAAMMDHWRELVPTPRYLEVQYEKVVDDLEGQARRMIEFLDLPWDEACLSFDKTRRPVRTASVNQVRQPIFKTSIGRWKPFADQLKPLLDALGGPG